MADDDLSDIPTVEVARLLELKERVASLAVPLPCASQTFAGPPSDVERHGMQRKAFLHQLRAASLLPPADGSDSSCDGVEHFIEFGAGNGALSYAVWLASRGACHSVLVDQRQSLTLNLSGVQAELPLPAGEIERLTPAGRALPRWEPHCACLDVTKVRVDYLRKAARGGTCVGLANHLCGDALDCAMRAAVDAWPGDEHGRLAAFVAATCCHHKIRWELFAGRRQFESWGLTRETFEQMRRWSRLAPRRNRESSTRVRVQVEARRLGVPPSEAAALGLSCRLLLDRARLHFLAENGFETSLQHHVPFEATADNILMVAVAPRRVGPGGAGIPGPQGGPRLSEGGHTTSAESSEEQPRAGST
mmetsp:Transcript_4880/g.16065  ORF Transcript_4880/g.16065 Transcript_4880/m.16065 type:complete len:362 (+) Transcript_4880:1263-2348(+)|eukprot:scaffold7704_cov112-Isochrysis_galbana.AAC.8